MGCYEWLPVHFTWQDAAAWVQAVGSILAIIAAYRVANAQWLNSKREKAQERAERLLQLKSVAVGCAGVFENAATWCVTPDEAADTQEQLQAKLRILGNVVRSIQFYEVPNTLVSDLVLRLVIELDRGVSLMNHHAISQRHLPENKRALERISEKFVYSQRLATHLAESLQQCADGEVTKVL